MSLKMRSLLGLLEAKSNSFRKRHKNHKVDWATASNNIETLGGKFERDDKENTSLRFSTWMLFKPHHLRTSFHIFKATPHLTRTWSSVSRSSSHIGHRVEWRSMPLESKLTRVGILRFSILQEAMLTLIGTSLFYLVEFVEDKGEEPLKSFLIL